MEFRPVWPPTEEGFRAWLFRDPFRVALLRVLRAYNAKRSPVCPVCSSNVFYSNAMGGGFNCGHCDSDFLEPVAGCPLDEHGLHDDSWMNDGICACGSNGAESA